MIRCSFCDKTQLEVRKVVAGAKAFICNECVEVAQAIMQDKPETPAVPMWPALAPQTGGRSTVVTCKVCALPAGLDEALVISGRGFVCAGCCGEIEASLAERREAKT
jgi:ATP-dependent protease Clp ATPase subunit